jgi:hypothetical protein
VIAFAPSVASATLGNTSKWMCGHRPSYAAGKMLVNVTVPSAPVSCNPRR